MLGYGAGAIGAVCGVLFLLAVAYNGVVEWLEPRGYDEGYTWALVVAGVVLTLGGVAVVDWRAAAVALAAFAASGLPMAVGSWWRHVRKRERGQAAMRQACAVPDTAEAVLRRHKEVGRGNGA
jgi:hypothetical protein